MYQMHRVFCATAWEAEGERRAFYEILGRINETDGIPAGSLFIPVSLVNIQDKRPYQYTVDDNIRQCRYYLLVPGDDWGPAARAFERDYRLALACASDSALPMQDTAILLRNQSDGSASPFAAVLDAAGFRYTTFTTTQDFEAAVTILLKQWLASGRTPQDSGTAAG